MKPGKEGNFAEKRKNQEPGAKKTALRASLQHGQREIDVMHAMHTWPERGSDTLTDLMLGLLVRVAALEAHTLPRDPSAMLHSGQLVHLSFYPTTHTSRGLFSEGSLAVCSSLQPSRVGRDLQHECPEVHHKEINSAPRGWLAFLARC